MQEVKLLRMELENFKCHEHLALDFGGKSALVRGANGVGKSTLAEGFAWVLFGKGDIRPKNCDGLAVTCGEVWLEVNGEALSLRRQLRELWKSRNGEPVSGGISWEFFICGVPVKRKVYEIRVRQIVMEEIFRLLTDPGKFLGGRWQDRRAILMDMARVGEMLPSEDLLTGEKSVEAYRQELMARKRSLAPERADAPIRISECRKLLEAVPEAEAYLRKRIEELRTEAAATAEQLGWILRMQRRLEETIRLRGAEAEREINALFPTVRFSLLHRCANGAEEEQCRASVNGIDYENLNQAARINAGLEVMDELCKWYGVRLPVFLDNAESITNPYPWPGQMIRLAVGAGALKVEYKEVLEK